MYMEEAAVCSGCLISDVRMCSMKSSGLLQSYKLLSGMQEIDAFEVYNVLDKLCWECAAHLRKFEVFRRKCETARKLLACAYTQANMEIFLRKVNRREHNLHSPLSVHLINVTSYLSSGDGLHFHDNDEGEHNSFVFDTDDDSVAIKKEQVEIKHDTTNEFPQVNEKKFQKRKYNNKKKTHVMNVKSLQTKKRTSEIVDNVGKPVRSNIKYDCSAFATEVMLTQEEQMKEIRNRQETSEYRDGRYKCEQCFKAYNIEKTYKNHMLKHDPVSGVYQCNVCKHRYKQRRHLVNHIYKVHMSKLHCKLCTYISQTTEQARIHYNWHTGTTYPCEVCGEVFSKKSTHLSHLRIKHPSQHICSACGESFVSEKGLVLHNSLMHKGASSNVDGPHCEVCDVRFVSTEVYHKHILISPKHEQDRETLPHGCRECGSVLDSEEALRQHARQHASSRSRRRTLHPPQCPECGVSVESATQFFHHFRRTHPHSAYPAAAAKTAVCEYCGKRFKTYALLSYHRNTHTGEREHECSQPACGKRFYSRAALAGHASTHTDARTHRCTLCHKAFKVKQALDRHSRIHTGARPYACNVCGKKFTDSSAHKSHVRSAHSAPDYTGS